jgi:hypothetical protein
MHILYQLYLNFENKHSFIIIIFLKNPKMNTWDLFFTHVIF